MTWRHIINRRLDSQDVPLDVREIDIPSEDDDDANSSQKDDTGHRRKVDMDDDEDDDNDDDYPEANDDDEQAPAWSNADVQDGEIIDIGRNIDDSLSNN